MKRFIACMLLIVSLGACEPEDNFITVLNTGVNKVAVSVEMDGCRVQAKSSLGAGVEDKMGGYTLLSYFHDTGQLEGIHELEGRDDVIEVRAGVPLDFVVVGGLWYIDPSSGSRMSYIAMCGKERVASESDLQALPAYRFDGKSADGVYRTETFSEVSEYGIPFSGSMEGVVVTEGMELSIPVVRMFAKVTVAIDHSGLAGTDADMFRKVSLRLCQASCKVHPFASVKAGSAEDLLEYGDYEPEISSSRSTSFVLYVPENMQGTLLSNGDPSRKTLEELNAQGKGSAAPFLTYVELVGLLDGSAGGYGGSLTYRFYLGSDNCSDFDIARNHNYNVSLGFRVNSIFDPYWKVGTGEDFSDSRMLAFAEDPQGERMIREGGTVAVRTERPGNMYLYFNKAGMAGDNQFSGMDEYEPGYDPGDASASAYSYSVTGLEKYGMTASLDRSTGRMTIAVSDESAFIPGRTIPVTVTLWPGGEEHSVNVMTYNNLDVLGNLDDFYLGMKRRITFQGFVGSSISVHASGNTDVLKTSLSDTGPYITDTAMGVSAGGTDLFAFGCADSMSLTFASEDKFNDGEVTRTFPVHLPEFNSENRDIRLFVDGTGVDIASPKYRDRLGRALEKKDFDATLYDRLLALEPHWSNDYGDEYVEFNQDELYIDYLGDSMLDWLGDRVDAGGVHNANTGFLGSVTIRPKSDRFTASSVYGMKVYVPYIETHFPSTVRSGYFNTFGPGEVSVESRYMTYGNTDIQFSTSSGTGGDRAQASILKSSDPDVSILRLHAGDGTDPLAVPYGVQSVEYGFMNRRIRKGISSMFTQTHVVFAYDVTLGQFAVFDGSPQMKVYITSPKAAWVMNKYYLGEEGMEMPEWDSVCGISEYNDYLDYSYSYTTGNNQSWTGASGENPKTFQYYDFFPDIYPQPVQWNETAAASVFNNRTFLGGLRFKDRTGDVLAQPLSYQYLGGKYYADIRLSPLKIGYVFSRRQ